MTPEQMLIATCLMYPDSVTLVRGKVEAEDFSDRRYGIIYQAITGQYAEAGIIDPVTVHQRATREGLLGVPLADLYRWLDGASSSVTAPTLAEQVKDAATRRQLSGLARIIESRARDMAQPVSDAVSAALDRLSAIREGATGGGGLHAKTLREILDAEDEEEDWVIPGLFERGDRLILTGWEGLGKTTWLRQIGICAAAGMNPVTLEPLDRRIKVLFVDVENSERQWRRETRGIATVAERGGIGSPRDYVHVHTGGRMDLRKDKDLGLVHRLVDEHQPEILVIGPIYRLVPTGINNDEEAAPLIAALDTLRDRGLVLMMEAHAPKGAQGERSLAPRGSAALMGWPEFGFGLAPDQQDENGRTMTAEVVRWRGDRDRKREWPRTLWAGGPFPWTADEVAPQARQASYGWNAAA